MRQPKLCSQCAWKVDLTPVGHCYMFEQDFEAPTCAQMLLSVRAITQATADATRYRLLKAHLQPGAPLDRPEGGPAWQVALPLAGTFDEAVDRLCDERQQETP